MAKKKILLSEGALTHSEVIVAGCLLRSLSYPVETVGIADLPMLPEAKSGGNGGSSSDSASSSSSNSASSSSEQHTQQ